jgi:hypothetical protein
MVYKVEIELPDGVPNPAAVAGALALGVGRTLVANAGMELAEVGLEIEDEADEDGLSDEAETPAPGTPYVGDEGPDALLELLGEIAPSTRHTLRLMAEASVDAGQIHGVELRDRLGIGSPSELAGILTSLGFAEKRTGLPKPYEQDWGYHDGVAGYIYSMDEEVARTILDLTDESGNIVKPA